MSDTETNEIVDAAGNPITRPPTVRERVKKASRSGRRAILWLIGAIAVLAALITNSGKIIDAIWPKKPETTEDDITVPDVAVRLRNTGPDEIVLPVRGEYWLWPPGLGAQHYTGAYELMETDRTDLETRTITLRPQGERGFLIHLMNPALSRYLSTGDYHIDFIFRTNQNGRNMVWSGPIPFTEEALSKNAYLIDVFEEPDGDGESE